jgi:GAF domain-containing protein
MSKVRRKVAGEERLLVGAVVIVDDDPASRQAVAERVRLGLGESEGVFTARESDEAVGLLKSLQEDPETEVLVVLVRLLPEVEAGVLELHGLIERIRSEAPSVPVIAYTDRLLAEVREHATAAGASACVSLEDVEAAVYGVFLEDEIGGLSEFTPTVAGVVHTINLGINIVDPQMRVLWANERLRSLVDGADETRQPCWGRYHKFYHRQCVCALCTAGLALRAAQDKIEAGSIGDNGRLTGSHILPVQGKVACVDVNAAPLLSGDKHRVLAIIEASRIVTEEWEKKTDCHDRIHEVIAAARVLGQEREGAPPFAAVSVYYRPKGGDDLHLFDSAFQEGHDVPKVVRLAELATAYRGVLEDRQPRFLDVARDDVAGDDVARRHFLWAGWTSLTERDVVIDVLYADEKAAGLFTEDLRPYWEYVIENFDTAHDSREMAFEKSADSFLQGFLAETANGIRDEASLEKVLKAAVECMDRALHPWSMYVRTLDRRTSTLVKRNGSGPYYNMAPEARELRYDGIASGMVAARRETLWSEHAGMEYIRQCVGRPLTTEEERDLQRIAGHATLPLECADRVLGALCIQFDDDSPLSPARRSFVEAMAAALGNALGSLEWAHQRRTIGKHSEELDRLMFCRSEHPEEEENELLTQITSKVFELTAAEIVAYYRYDGQSHKLMLVSGATQGSVPKDMALPQVIPADVGVVSRAAGNRQGYRVWDYRTTDWQTVRNRLLAHFPEGPEGEFCRWVGSEIAEPVLGRQQAVAGVLVALSSIPGWLSADDEEVVREFALKTGLCLEAKELMRKLNWHTRTEITLNDITAAMARTSDAGMLYRLLLLGVTADECLGFSRAMLLLRQDADRFVTAEAVGARSRSVAEQQWQEASAIPLSRKVEACSQTPLTRPGDLRELIGQLAMDLRQNPDIPGRLHHKSGSEEDLLQVGIVPSGGEAFVLHADR